MQKIECNLKFRDFREIQKIKKCPSMEEKLPENNKNRIKKT